MSREDDLRFIERKHGVNIDVTDEDGCTTVYAYTEYGDSIALKFDSMSPDAVDVLTVASGIDNLRVIANKRPRVGRVRTT